MRKIKYNLVRDKGVNRKQKCSSYHAYYMPAFFLVFIVFAAAVVVIVVFTFTAYGIQYDEDGHSFSFFLGDNNLAFASPPASSPASEDIAIKKGEYIDNDLINVLSDSVSDGPPSSSSSVPTTMTGKMTTATAAVAVATPGFKLQLHHLLVRIHRHYHYTL